MMLDNSNQLQLPVSHVTTRVNSPYSTVCRVASRLDTVFSVFAFHLVCLIPSVSPASPEKKWKVVVRQSPHLNPTLLTVAPEFLPLCPGYLSQGPRMCGRGQHQKSGSTFILEGVGCKKVLKNKSSHTMSWVLPSPPHRVSMDSTLQLPTPNQETGGQGLFPP